MEKTEFKSKYIFSKSTIFLFLSGLISCCTAGVLSISGGDFLYKIVLSFIFLFFYFICLINSKIKLTIVEKENFNILVAFLIFCLIPFLPTVVTSSTHLNLLIFFEALFRIFFLYSLFQISRTNNINKFWNGYFSGVFLFFLIYLFTFLNVGKSSNTGGIYLVIITILFLYFSNSRLLKFLIFILSIFILYFIFQSRAQTFGLLSGSIILYSPIIFNLFRKFTISILLLITISITTLFILIDLTRIENLSWVTSYRGLIWWHYIYSFFNTGSFINLLLGFGHGASTEFMNLINLYDVTSKINKDLIQHLVKIGGIHNSFIYILLSRGIIGLIIFFYIIKKLLIRIHKYKLNIILFMVSYISFLFSGQSTLAGLSLETVLMTLSLCVPIKKN